ncbi:hypothetical protein [Occallatibacter savannae]|uniref:hypothetical protein n=1 Tax=Occallatibacter savannae TaxID=1002691 RepID=UPI0013A5B7DA|nr:hypothetical protein [Occallatibacter savannae]
MTADSHSSQIEAIRKVLEEAKAYSGLGPNDPSVIALEQIMSNKITELASRTDTAGAAPPPAPSPDPST